MNNARVDSPLRRRLTPEAADLYDFVSSTYPRYEGWFWTRRGSARDDAFRNLLRAAQDDSHTPRRWQQVLWADDEVVAAARDRDLRRRAWATLASTDSDGWLQRWIRRNEADRLFEYSLNVAAVAAIATIAAWNFLT